MLTGGEIVPLSIAGKSSSNSEKLPGVAYARIQKESEFQVFFQMLADLTDE